jgi:Ca2+-binding EF-hand superfamily protein
MQLRSIGRVLNDYGIFFFENLWGHHIMFKQKFLISVVSLSLLAAPLISVDAFAHGGKGGKRPNRQPPVVRMSLLKRLDTNGDGILTLDEFSSRNAKRAKRLFKRLDQNGDSALSLDEFSVAGGPGGDHGGPGGPGDDLDQNALELCMEEILGYELPQPPTAEEAFAAADTNEDDSVDLEEFLAADDARAAERFAEIDGDSDGGITKEEIKAYRATEKERHKAHRTCVAEQLDVEELLN